MLSPDRVMVKKVNDAEAKITCDETGEFSHDDRSEF